MVSLNGCAERRRRSQSRRRRDETADSGSEKMRRRKASIHGPVFTQCRESTGVGRKRRPEPGLKGLTGENSGA